MGKLGVAGVALLVLINSGIVFAQSIPVSGIVIDKVTRQPVSRASVAVKDGISGIFSGDDGKFVLRVKAKLPFSLIISCIGYKDTEYSVTASVNNISIELEPENLLGQEIVVSASRMPEHLLESPVSVERMGGGNGQGNCCCFVLRCPCQPERSRSEYAEFYLQINQYPGIQCKRKHTF